MFDVIRKAFLWDALNRGLLQEIGKHGDFHLKTIQDLAVWNLLRDSQGQTIAEVGGGDSRILRSLAKKNTCYNIEKFQGADGGPAKEIVIPGVTNIHAFVGERGGKIPTGTFDCLFSVSVVEHIPDAQLTAFLEECIDCLKPGGRLIHAIDIYISDEPSSYWTGRHQQYLNWLDHPALEPLGEVNRGPLKFSCSMASNPDNIMHSWSKIAPQLDSLRQVAQSVSLLFAMRKAG